MFKGNHCRSSLGPTTEAFLVSIDDRLGTALEKIVPNAFGDKGGQTPDEIKKES